MSKREPENHTLVKKIQISYSKNDSITSHKFQFDFVKVFRVSDFTSKYFTCAECRLKDALVPVFLALVDAIRVYWAVSAC